MFRYYWLSNPSEHPYQVTSLPGYNPEWLNQEYISSVDQLYWGMYRFYVDALLYFGSIRTAFQTLRGSSENELNLFFEKLTINKDSIINRGPALDLNPIAKDERYLISERACKSYELGNKGETEITQGLLEMYRESQLNGHRIVSFRQLLEGDFAKKSYNETQSQFQFAAVGSVTYSV